MLIFLLKLPILRGSDNHNVWSQSWIRYGKHYLLLKNHIIKQKPQVPIFIIS
jgi:hypothetical protein